MKTKLLLIIIIIIFAVHNVFAQQSMLIHSDTSIVYKSLISDIDSIKFQNNSANINHIDNTISSMPLQQIDSFTFEDATPSYKILRVGVDKPYKTVRAAADAAGDSSIIEIDAGTYKGDVAGWKQDALIIRAVGGEVILDAGGKSYDNMGIWKIDRKDGNILVEGITFINAKVNDHNGAGIRLVNGHLKVVNCKFLHNEMGILTGNLEEITFEAINCEFGYSGAGDGYSHNLYIGFISKAYIEGCYFHHANNGHLFKSRAAQTIVKYCLLEDGFDKDALSSYELNFPSGGEAIVVGNIIQQSINSPNSAIISFAEEHSNKYNKNTLYMAFNTIVNSKTTTNNAIYAPNQVLPGCVFLYNNLFSTNAALNPNITLGADIGNQKFTIDNLSNNYHPTQETYNLWKNVIDLNIDSYLPAEFQAQGISLIPTKEYIHPLATGTLNGLPEIPGAYQTIVE